MDIPKYGNEEIEQRALEIWREREMEFPPRVRRMKPDMTDFATGTWRRVLLQAKQELENKKKDTPIRMPTHLMPF